jgi:hypothetical protein
MTTNVIAGLITADFALLILVYCLKAIFLPNGVEGLETQETLGDRPQR